MELQVQKREKVGKGLKVLRKNGLIPAELYGRNLTNLHLVVSKKELNKVLKSAKENKVIELKIDNEIRPVLIHDIQFNPLSDEIINVDFYQIRLDEKIKIKVPVEFVGVSPAVKDRGGVLIKAIQEIEIETLPNKIPSAVKVDISNLKEIGDNLYVKDLIGGDFKILVSPETAVATVAEKMAEEVVAAAPVIDISAVKVETEEKKKAREAEKVE